jgi:Ser/Thr protein kinase RdoA (MazF antagonist)
MSDDAAPDVPGVYASLDPDTILAAVETAGLRCDGRIHALNSYENRVYEVGIEDDTPVIGKFYRPGRWSDAAILEEHAFCAELAALEIPVVAPLAGADGKTLRHVGAHRLALFPRRGGRPPELDDPDQLQSLGRVIARLHNVGAAGVFRERPELEVEHFAVQSVDYLLAHGFIPAHLDLAYRAITGLLIGRLRETFADTGRVARLRLHGDCHPGNVMMRDGAPHLVDFDDARSGPAVQDLWMFLAGERAERTAGIYDLLDGYTEFREFDAAELRLIEPLRTLRIMHYAAWLARRWDDPAFPRAFPWFNTTRYWEEHILALKEQFSLLDEPSLVWRP